MSDKKNSNMKIWGLAEKTDPKFTKSDGVPNGLTAINGVYIIKKATEIFGSIGIGWGFDIIEERYDKGVPFLTKDKLETCELIHTIQIELWYMQGEAKGKVKGFGHTKYIYPTKNGYMTDGEAPKKSLTDAIKKCLSMLGFGADIHMGQFEDKEYLEDRRLQSEIDNADNKDEVRLKQAKEHQEWLKAELGAYRLIDDKKALKTINVAHKRKANRRGDSEGVNKFTVAYDVRLAEIEKTIKESK
jgi:hypothetical protein